MRGRLRYAVAVSSLLLAGCGGGGSSPAGSSTHQAARLVGLWRVVSTRQAFPGELPATVRIGATSDDFVVVRQCGVVAGMWRATDGGALAAEMPLTGKVCDSALIEPPWVTFAWSYRFAGDRLQILNDEGTVQATLTRTDKLGTAQEAGAAPTPSAALLDALRTPAKVPHGMTPVTKPNQVGGLWALPNAGDPHQDNVSFLSNHYLGVLENCGLRGHFSYDRSGVFVATGTPDGAGCATSHVLQWIRSATRLALHQGKLAFIDRGGHVLGELMQVP
ncbi:MAG: hypothetical protein JO079_05730 [Frankiaceae bacterium]|nr:hypothetical protein [Frankiaceae bacterium]MBV9368382.1 hypothetical protein [Frankiales bacterium]